jgi:hypothetical protein
MLSTTRTGTGICLLSSLSPSCASKRAEEIQPSLVGLAGWCPFDGEIPRARESRLVRDTLTGGFPAADLRQNPRQRHHRFARADHADAARAFTWAAFRVFRFRRHFRGCHLRLSFPHGKSPNGFASLFDMRHHLHTFAKHGAHHDSQVGFLRLRRFGLGDQIHPDVVEPIRPFHRRNGQCPRGGDQRAERDVADRHPAIGNVDGLRIRDRTRSV